MPSVNADFPHARTVARRGGGVGNYDTLAPSPSTTGKSAGDLQFRTGTSGHAATGVWTLAARRVRSRTSELGQSTDGPGRIRPVSPSRGTLRASHHGLDSAWQCTCHRSGCRRGASLSEWRRANEGPSSYSRRGRHWQLRPSLSSAGRLGPLASPLPGNSESESGAPRGTACTAAWRRLVPSRRARAYSWPAGIMPATRRGPAACHCPSMARNSESVTGPAPDWPSLSGPPHGRP